MSDLTTTRNDSCGFRMLQCLPIAIIAAILAVAILAGIVGMRWTGSGCGNGIERTEIAYVDGTPVSVVIPGSC